MATNISKYCQLNDFLLCEYEFNRDNVTTNISNPHVVDSCLGTLYFYEDAGALSTTGNALSLNSIPTNEGRTSWYFDDTNPYTTYKPYWNTDTSILGISSYPMDTIKIHIVSGYNFDDVGGFLLQVRTKNASTGDLLDLANFTYAKQLDAINNGILNFSSNTLFLGNRFYDKYLEFKVPSVQYLGNDTTSTLGIALNVEVLSDVYLTYSTILDIVENEYIIDEQINVQLPVTSAADNFNCFIAESTEGDYIEYYATWANTIIGDYMGDIESGRIKLYTSNNPNDNFEEFTSSYGTGAAKWIIIHEISVYEQIPGSSLLTQKYSFTQDSNFSLPNYFRPILKNADIDTSYLIQYTCRLTNRMDGTQIIRKASFSSTDPKKYGIWFTRLTVENLIPYKVFNKIEAEKSNIVVNSNIEKTKYVKVFYDTVSVVLNSFNEVFPQGTGPMFLKSYDSTYKFKFEKIDTNGSRLNVDLSGVFNYALVFKLDNNTKIEIGPTYSTNMNTTIGELEFKLTEDQLFTLKKQTYNNYSIIVKNPNGTSYTFYEGVFYPLSDEKTVLENYKSMYTVTDLQARISELEAEVQRLTDENTTLKLT